MRLLINLNDVTAPNVKYTNYIDLNSNIVNKSIDVLGSIFNGQGVGLSPTGGGLVPTFDLRASLVGRVLGSTGVISDTPIGQAGAKYLTLALANNAAFGLQQETIGNLNLNPLNLAKNGLGGIVVPNYDITVPSGQLGRVIDFGARVLGFESPFSLYERNSSIFQSENPVANITRANAQLANTGKGQVLSLFANVKMNKYKPGFQDDRVVGGDAEKAQKGSGINSNIYAFGTSDGQVIDLLNTDVDVNDDGSLSFDEFGVNAPISQSNYNLDGLINNSGFGEASDGEVNGAPFSWADEFANKDSSANANFNEPKSLLYKTQTLFNTNKMRTIVSGHGGDGLKGKTQTQSSVQRGFISKGSGVLSNAALTSSLANPEDVFCRTWTTFDRYDQVQDLQKSSGIVKGENLYRNGYTAGDSVLGDNGFVKIGPYIGDDKSVKGDGDTNIKNFMFSLENLAWADNKENLLDCELGPGDPMGKRGRIMWFPPYDINITENVSVSWESTNFIGRGEPIYTYNNTERTGTLQFKIVVDHPSYLNAIRGESDEYLASFFAGCTDIDPLFGKKLTAVEKNNIEVKNAPPAQRKQPETQSPSVPSLSIYLPNDVSIPDETYEDVFNEELDENGTTEDSGTVSIVKATSTNRTNFGLNGNRNPTLGDVGGWFTPSGIEKLRKALNEDCPACTIDIKGYASQQGQVLNPTGNRNIQINRANELRKWLEINVLAFDDNIKKEKIRLDDRFKPWNDNNKVGGIQSCPVVAKGINDTICLKESRKAVATFRFDADLALKLTDNEKDPVVAPAEKFRVNQEILNRFYNECNYFEKLSQDSPTVYKTLKEKLRFFHPAFHAITPEGLNSRLTFLQQCTRQGPTNGLGGPDNLAFGRPPICILRLGDFYHTKIVIDNVGVSYDPLVWDLNPEGIGVQPMIATVDLSFKMIGGQSMKGPINKLQNAVSFNFFGNTQVYDERADKLEKNTDTVYGEGEYKLVPGRKKMPNSLDIKENENKDGINGNGDETVAKDQQGLVDKQSTEEQSTEEQSVSGGTEFEITGFKTINVGAWEKTLDPSGLIYTINFTLNSNNIYDESGNLIADETKLKEWIRKNGIKVILKPVTLFSEPNVVPTNVYEEVITSIDSGSVSTKTLNSAINGAGYNMGSTTQLAATSLPTIKVRGSGEYILKLQVTGGRPIQTNITLNGDSYQK